MSIRSRFEAWALRTTACGLLRWFATTNRYEIVRGEEVLEALEKRGGPAIFCLWHESIFVAGAFIIKELWPVYPMVLLGSASRDGEIVKWVADGFGVPCVRGSSSRGGSRALKELHRWVARKGLSVVMVPDGPRGPSGKSKFGALVLSRLTGAAVVPLGFEVENGWRMGSWDRTVLPRPGTRVRLCVGDAVVVPRDASDEQLEALRVQLDEALGPVLTFPRGVR